MEKILVVDDEPGVLTLCRRVLERDGYTVTAVATAEDAQENLKHEVFDLVLTDLKLGGITGIDLLKQIKDSYPQTEVIVITGQATVETAIEAIKSGAYDYISKPFNISELGASVKKALDFSRLKRQENIFRETTYLYKLSQEITANRTESEVLDFILDRAVMALHSDSGSIFIYLKDKDQLHPMAVHGTQQVEELKIGERIAGWVAQKRQPLLLQNGLDSMPQFSDLPKRHDIVSSMVVPLIDQESFSGVICLTRYNQLTNYQFTPRDLESLQVFALHATLILSSLRHHQGLRELDKLKSEFVANVSHELRTPLMAISGAMELMENYLNSIELKNEKKTTLVLDLVKRNTERMSRLVNDLLDFSRIESKQTKLLPMRFSLNELIKETVEDFIYRAKEKEIVLTSDIKDPDINMNADREKIKQIIANLLANAIKFTAGSGTVKLECAKSGPETIVISVSDSGIGIPKENQKKIFDKFYQVDGSISRAHSGFGIGLSIVKSTVEEHKGKVWFESEPGKGSKFFVQLPMDVESVMGVPDAVEKE
jgi:signal transduction histidine kinase/DNA-binding response OmpR family regulator